MDKTDQKLIDRTKIDECVFLEHVINAAGVPYSVIFSEKDGYELSSLETSEDNDKILVASYFERFRNAED